MFGLRKAHRLGSDSGEDSGGNTGMSEAQEEHLMGIGPERPMQNEYARTREGQDWYEQASGYWDHRERSRIWEYLGRDVYGY